MDRSEKYAAIWEAALYEALPVLLAYFSTYQLGNTPVGALDSNNALEQMDFVRFRMELARASLAAPILSEAAAAFTIAHAHRVTYDSLMLRGNLHLPSFIREYTMGFPRGIPSVSRSPNLASPENLLISEVLEHLARLGASPAPRITTEAAEIERYQQIARDIDGTWPWSEVRYLPRDSINELSWMVIDRGIAGAIPPDHPAIRLAELFGIEGPRSVEVAKDSVSLFVRLISDEEARDKLFELVVLQWLWSAAQKIAATNFNARALAGIEKGPVLSFEAAIGTTVKIWFQSSKPMPPARYRAGTSRLGGVPDFVISVAAGGKEVLSLIDPKCRVGSSETEVAYKLLGYKEAFFDAPYMAAAIFPDFGEGKYRRTYFRKARGLGEGLPFIGAITLMRTPLAQGAEETRRLLVAIIRASQRLLRRLA